MLCFAGCLFIIFVITPLTGLSGHFGQGHDGYIQIAENLGKGNGAIWATDRSCVDFKAGDCLLVPAVYEGAMRFVNDSQYLTITI
jgi:hypothetical protein